MTVSLVFLELACPCYLSHAKSGIRCLLDPALSRRAGSFSSLPFALLLLLQPWLWYPTFNTGATRAELPSAALYCTRSVVVREHNLVGSWRVLCPGARDAFFVPLRRSCYRQIEKPEVL